MALAQAAASGQEMGQKTPSRFGGISDMIMAVTADLRQQKATKDKTSQENKKMNYEMVKALLDNKYRPTDMNSFNKVLDTGEIPGFTKANSVEDMLSDSFAGNNNTQTNLPTQDNSMLGSSPAAPLLDKSLLLRGMISKTYGIPFEQVMTPDERGKTIEERKFQMEKAEKDKVSEKQLSFAKQSALDYLKTIDEVEKGIKNFGAVGKLPSIPWDYKRVNWEKNFDTLKSKKMIDLMTTMKEASKTGSTGFGQLSEKEGKILISGE